MGQIKDFQFSGTISSSKSLMNRALIVQSFFPELQIIGDSRCDDVIKMQKALLSFEQQEPMDCGAAGTTLRFLMARASRETTESYLYGDDRLFERPHKFLIDKLKNLGASLDFPEKNYLRVRGSEWHTDQVIDFNSSPSSQFPSSLLLNAWNLKDDLKINFDQKQKSYSYFKMTMDFLKNLGMEIIVDGNIVAVAKHQKIRVRQTSIEPDMSSCFAIAALAACCGHAEIKNFPQTSLQPDFKFIEILKEMNVSVVYDSDKKSLQIKKSEELKPLNIDLNNNPDLFPVLAVMLSRASGVSEVTGIDHLVHKESNRIENTMDLIQSVGAKCFYENKKFSIKGNPNQILNQNILFNPDQDHRMVMAAVLLRYLGAGIEIENPYVVNKSFPEFLNIVELE